MSDKHDKFVLGSYRDVTVTLGDMKNALQWAKRALKNKAGAAKIPGDGILKFRMKYWSGSSEHPCGTSCCLLGGAVISATGNRPVFDGQHPTGVFYAHEFNETCTQIAEEIREISDPLFCSFSSFLYEKDAIRMCEDALAAIEARLGGRAQ
jgi:hypothetical protein